MTGLSYSLKPLDQFGARFGMIVLQVDETIEGDFRLFLSGSDASLNVTRVASGADLTPETIAAMADRLTASAALLPPTHGFDVIAYACTSAACQLGPGRVADLIRAGRQTRHVTDPLTAADAALKALGAGRVGVVSPYIESVAQPLCAAFAARGHTVPSAVSFGEQVEANVARIDEASIIAAAQGVARAAPVDAVFLSCTNLRTATIIEPLEERLGVPVLSSNQVLAWHMARLAGAAGVRVPGALGHLS